MPKLTSQEIGMNIRTARKNAGLTLDQLGEQIGMSKQNLSNLERGLYEISLATANKIAFVLNCKVDSFCNASE